jgi:isocitrate dehydrogenase kinase/phosphatase
MRKQYPVPNNGITSLLDSLLVAKDIAGTILRRFNNHIRIYRDITHSARVHFVRGDWAASRAIVSERISLYDTRVKEAIDELRTRFDLAEVDLLLWAEVKLQYLGMLYKHRQPELAETFYNSVFTHLFERHHYNDDNIFVRPSISTERIDGDAPTYRSFYPTREGWRASLTRILRECDIGLPFEDMRRDIKLILRRLWQLPIDVGDLHQQFQLQVLNSLFYRNKAACLVGRAMNGAEMYPFILPLLRTESGQVYVDALVTEPDDVANLFSFSRAYFLVDTQVPAAVVRFLLTLLPGKSTADMYTCIGYHKQGKNEFYRDFLDHLRHSSDRLEAAPGIKGMVMLVFTLPSYPYVFKVIKDHFAPPKDTTRQEVVDKHRWVKQHDRVGRMADTWEFSYAEFPRERFTEELLSELQQDAPSQVILEGNSVVIKHLFIERRLNPLNLYLEKATAQQVELALQEYGDAIKDIAAAGIFPGDLLFKNFGLSRHRRVIFYDYDEIVPIGECNFRKIPPPRTEEDEMAAEPWYSVGPADVFPEEFPTFLLSNIAWRRIFVRLHPELMDAAYWQHLQETVAQGGFPDVFPYRGEIRFLQHERTPVQVEERRQVAAEK